MTWAGWMRLCASLTAMRRISWMDQRISDGERYSLICAVFLGRRGVRAVPDGGHHGEGQHHERDVAMPSVPRARLVVVEPQLVFRGFKAVFNPLRSYSTGQPVEP